MNADVIEICKNNTGINKLSRLTRMFDIAARKGEPDLTELARDITNCNTLAGYVVFTKPALGMSAKDVEAEIFSGYRLSEKELPIEEKFYNWLGLMLAWNRTEDYKDKLLQEWLPISPEGTKEARRAKKEKYKADNIKSKDKKKEDKVAPDKLMVDAVIAAESLLRSNRILPGEVILLIADFLFEMGFISDTSSFEFHSIYKSIYYNFDMMSERGKKIAGDYFNKLLPFSNKSIAASFLRKIDGDFSGYEAVFGMTKEELIRKALESSDNSYEIPYRILRCFYGTFGISEAWVEDVERYVKNKNIVQWAQLLYFYDKMYEEVNENSENNVLGAVEKEKEHYMTEMVNGDVHFAIQKSFYYCSRLISKAILKGYNLEQFLDVMGPLNICKYEKDMQSQSSYLDDEHVRNENAEASGLFLSEYTDHEKLIEMFFKSNMHQIIPFRNLVERIGNDLLDEGKKENEINDRIVFLFKDYKIKGMIRRYDKEFCFTGLYSVETSNLKSEHGYGWVEIFEQDLDDAEIRRRCDMIPKTDYNTGLFSKWRFEKRDAVLYFNISGVLKKKQDSYEGCNIFTGNLEPVKFYNGTYSGIRFDDHEIIDAAMESAMDWLKNPWDDKGKLSQIQHWQFLVEPARVGKSKEYALQVLETYLDNATNENRFKSIYYTLRKNFVDRINEFYYKPGNINKAAIIEFTAAEKGMLIEKAKNLLRMDIPTERKMQIYMNTCLKTVYFLDLFILQLPKTDSPLKYSGENEYPYYLFPITYTGETENCYKYSFRCGYASKYANNLQIEKEKVSPKVAKSTNLFAEIFFFSMKESKIQLYRVLTKEQIKNDSFSLLKRELNDLKKDNDKRNIMRRLRKVAAYMKKLETDIGMSQFIPGTIHYFKAWDFKAETLFWFFVAWNIDGLSIDLDPESLNRGLENNIRGAINEMIANNGAEDIPKMMAVYKHSYLSAAVSFEDFKDMLVNAYSVSEDVLDKYFTEDKEFRFAVGDE